MDGWVLYETKAERNGPCPHSRSSQLVVVTGTCTYIFSVKQSVGTVLSFRPCAMAALRGERLTFTGAVSCGIWRRDQSGR